MASNYTLNLPNDIIYDSGLLYIGTTPVGVSRGGLQFDPGIKLTSTEFDGMRTPIAGLDRRTAVEPKITGKFLPFGTGSIPNYDIGGTSAWQSSSLGHGQSSGSYLPVSASSYYSVAAGQYLNNVALYWTRAGGGYAGAVIETALITTYKIAGTDKKEAEIDITIEGRLFLPSGSATTDTPPYYYILCDTIPSFAPGITA